MNQEIFFTNSPDETEKIGSAAAQFALNIDGFFVIALYGDLGAGKTAFTRGFASVISPDAMVKSPTYTVVNEYIGGKSPLYHFDMYRITDDDELYSIGYYDYPESGNCIIEWSENIEFAIPEDAIRVTIEKIPDSDSGEYNDKRKITIEYNQNIFNSDKFRSVKDFLK